MPVGTQRAASALFVVLGRCTQRPYPHFHLSSLLFASAHRSPLNVIRKSTLNFKRYSPPLTPNDCPPETGATRSEATEGVDKTPLTAHRSYILYNKVYSPHSLLLLSFLHPFLQFS